MAKHNDEKITGLQKAAILLITLGPEKSANVFKHLKEEETKIEKYNNEYLLLNEVSSSEWVRIND